MEALELFLSSIRSPHTMQAYNGYFKKYQEFIAAAGGGNTNLNSGNIFFGNNPRLIEEKIIEFIMEVQGPSGTEIVFDIPFIADNVLKLYEKVENGHVQFVLRDMITGDARSLNWASVKESLDLFMNKPFEYLWNADYMPAPVKQELRQEAIAQGLIGGVTSDYQISSSSSKVGVE